MTTIPPVTEDNEWPLPPWADHSSDWPTEDDDDFGPPPVVDPPTQPPEI